VCGFDGGAASVGVGLMVVLSAWVWLRLWEKKKEKLFL
jgi:hypothetical protein